MNQNIVFASEEFFWLRFGSYWGLVAVVIPALVIAFIISVVMKKKDTALGLLVSIVLFGLIAVWLGYA